MTLGDGNGYVTYEELAQVRRIMYRLALVATLFIAAGVFSIVWIRTANQDDIRRVSCANSQSLVDQFEWLSALAAANQNHLLTPAQVHQRQVFYTQAEHLAVQRAGGTCATLGQMQTQAVRDIAKAFSRSTQ